MRFFYFAMMVILAISSTAIAQTATDEAPQNFELVGLLPPAQEGWTRDTESEPILKWVRREGNGAASAEYKNASRKFTITFSTDQKKVAAIGSIVNNPDMIEIFNGKKQDLGGIEFLFVNTQYYAVLEDRISIESSVSADEIVARHLETIDFKALSEVGQ